MDLLFGCMNNLMKLLNEFGVFTAVVEAGSFTRAAATLGMSKAAVSDHVSRLEERLGVQLLRRTTRQLSLTDAGEACYQHTRRMRDEADAAVRAAAEHQSEPVGRLRVACPETYLDLFLMPIATRFLEANPRIDLELCEAPYHVDLIGDRFDMAIRIGDLPDSGLVARRLGWSRTSLVASPAYLAAAGPIELPHALAGLSLLHFSPFGRDELWDLRGPDGVIQSVHVRSRLATDSGGALLAAAKAGAGIALLPDWMTSQALAAGELSLVLPGWGRAPVPVQAIYPGHSRVSIKVSAFIKALAAGLAGAGNGLSGS